MENNEIIEELISLIKTLSVSELKEALEHYHNNDIAHVLGELTDIEKEKLLKALDKEDFSDIVTYMDEAKEYLENIDNEKVADIVELLDADEAVDLLEELDEDDAKEVLENIEDKELVEDIKLILSLDDEMIGSKMTTNYIAIKKDIRVKEAMRILIEEAKDHDNITTLYVVDENDKFLGTLELTELIIARKDEKIDDLYHSAYPFVRSTELISNCIERIKDYGLNLIPVLDDNDVLIGVITSEALVETVDEELSDDYAKLAGLTGEEDLEEPIATSVKKRLPWLALLMGLGMVVSMLISSFEAAIATITVIVFFQSMILDMAGNSGTQSLAVTIRLLSDEEVDNRKIGKLIFKEMLIGLTNGIIFGIFSFVIVYLFLFISKAEVIAGSGYNNADALKVAFIVSISLLGAMTLSTMVGTMMPLIFKKLKIDPAVASGPFITTINDISAVVIYYGLATLLFII